ncbi:glycine cleavage system protein R [Ferrimonas sp.]|uniref:glycine cleavage system protein R n=1 Tax=Ferrimonas sp. TaxID=2080861 RepID=UPI003A8EBDB2
MDKWIASVIGEDYPGITETLAQILKDNGANWLDASLRRVGDRYAGIIELELPKENSDALKRQLADVPKLSIVLQPVAPKSQPVLQFQVEVIGNDRPGIVAAVTQILKANHANIEQLESDLDTANHTGVPLFRLNILLAAPDEASLDRIEQELFTLGDDLMVEYERIAN